MVSALRCYEEGKNLPGLENIGEIGWPCFRGGSVPVHYVNDLQPARKRSCMVFYSPITPPQLPIQYNSHIFSRVERYRRVVMHCWETERKQPVVDLSNLAVCVMKTYPDGLTGTRSQLAQLRGVAMVVGSVPGSSNMAGYGAALPGGNLEIDCIPASLPAADWQLCHAALFSSVEHDLSSKPSRLKRRRISPEGG